MFAFNVRRRRPSELIVCETPTILTNLIRRRLFTFTYLTQLCWAFILVCFTSTSSFSSFHSLQCLFVFSVVENFDFFLTYVFFSLSSFTFTSTFSSFSRLVLFMDFNSACASNLFSSVYCNQILFQGRLSDDIISVTCCFIYQLSLSRDFFVS